MEYDILSLILKFADDTKVFGRVLNSAQRPLLQDDPDKLCVWADSWQMEFNVDKCKAMHIGSRTKQLWSLEERRNRADLIKLFKMVWGLSSVPLQTYFQLADGRYTRGHKWKLVKAHSTCDARLYFFSVRVLNRWNSLPHCTVDVKTVNAFKNQLEKIRSKRVSLKTADHRRSA